MRSLLAALLMSLAASIDPKTVAELAVRAVKAAADESGMVLVKGDTKQEWAIARKVTAIAKHNRPDLFKD